jgi:hypothetical protein
MITEFTLTVVVGIGGYEGVTAQRMPIGKDIKLYPMLFLASTLNA